MADKQSKKGPDKAESLTSVRTRAPMLITDLMKSCIKDAQKMVKDGCTKAEASREVFDSINGLERRQVTHVFKVGVGLTNAGAQTYYTNCKKAHKPK